MTLKEMAIQLNNGVKFNYVQALHAKCLEWHNLSINTVYSWMQGKKPGLYWQNVLESIEADIKKDLTI